MAVSGVNAYEASTPLLDDGVDGVVDYKNGPVLRSKSGGWRSAIFIIGNILQNYTCIYLCVLN